MSLSENPPVKSWELEFHSMVAAIKNGNISDLPIEQAQKQFIEANKIEVPSNIIIEQVILDERYRQESRKHLEKGLKKYEDVLDEKWKEPNDRLRSAESNRTVTFKYAKHAKARVFSIDYRIAPQNQFPASLCDSVAAYLYLLDP
ncbi:8270_t:CDS:2, partial [Dentiscutata erythropus]